MNLSEKCFTFMLALIAQSYGLLDGVQNSSAWYFCEVPRWDGKCGKERFSWCFLFHEVFCDFGPDTIYPCPFTLFIHSYDLNNGTPMFCLLAVLLFFIAAEEECLDYQPLSQRTLWTVIIFLFFLSIFLKKKTKKTMSPWWNHKIRLQDFSGRHLTELCFEHFDVVCHVRCQLKIRLPNLKKKKKKKKYISWLQVQRDNLQALILKAAVGWAILPNDH